METPEEELARLRTEVFKLGLDLQKARSDLRDAHKDVWTLAHIKELLRDG